MATTINRTRWLTWPTFIIAVGVYSLLFYRVQADTATLQQEADHSVAAMATTHYTTPIKVNQTGPLIVVAKHNPFRLSSVWAYVSEQSLLKNGYVASNIKDFNGAIAHASESNVSLVPVAGVALQRLFADAKQAGYPLALSSAYRTMSDQSELYKNYLTHYGQRYVDEYVARPGASEHHTGLAVDISDYTRQCVMSADHCSLSTTTATWLAQHAPQYGFILRYPENKQAVTGVSFEPWHFRYIGASAPILTKSGLTLDEFVKKVEDSEKS